MKYVVFDIDGTLANIEHRRKYVAIKPKNWKAFKAGIPFDTPYDDIIELLGILLDEFPIILCSGRGEEDRHETELWLKNNYCSYDKLYMRPAGDYRKDSIVKVELLNKMIEEYGCKPFLWFDDRNQVVDAIRGQGVRVLQVAPGNF
jgi:hypothetical protein